MEVLVVDYNAENGPEQFAYSLRHTGFAVVKNHPIKESLINHVYSQWEAFFASDVTHDYLFDRVKQDGFFPIEAAESAKGFALQDIKEMYHVYPWGRMPSIIDATTMQLYGEMSNLAATLLSWIQQNTPEDIAQNYSIPLSEMITDSPNTLLRILHYPPFTGSEQAGAVRAAKHEDINLITLLPAATDGGLQVQDNFDNWHDVPCKPGTIIVNTGDMLQMCSDGYFKSTSHRVLNPVGEAAKRSRLSMPLFLHPRDDVRLSATHTQATYLLERLRELGLKE